VSRALILALALGAASSAYGAQLDGLEAEATSILGVGQGVYVETADGTVLLAEAAEVAVHPASVSKVPTTLALLRKLGPGHRFTTTFASSGRIRGGTLHGDLLVESDGDPAFVDEDALLVVDRLHQSGIRRVAGSLRVRGPFTFDWQDDGDGSRLRQALSGRISPRALMTVRAMQLENPNVPAPRSLRAGIIQFTAPVAELAEGPTTAGGTGPLEARPLVVHRSQPLLSLAKGLNDYSNNIFAPLADQAGGAQAVETLARSVVPEAMRPEITLGDGAGADPRNRLSPRAAVRLLRALDQELASTGHHLFDILPVAGIDAGTLHDRLNGPAEVGRVVGKTGTFGSYGASALVGAITTSDHGIVYFAILNHDVPVPEARRRQDQFVRNLLAHLHSLAWNYQVDPRPAVARVEVAAAPQ
jgi:serine-type D-Ala-D-Ala carboxypeptidase/endopeptidase (penicillin-binding protein 4)